MVDLDTPVEIQEAQSFTSRRMLDFVNERNVFDPGVDYPAAMFEERRKVTAGDIAIFVDSGAQHGAPMLEVPLRVIGAAAKKEIRKGVLLMIMAFLSTLH